MAKIAIIDDSKDQSETLSIVLQEYLNKYNSSLEVIIKFPFESPISYFNYIMNEDICVLILDERLNDQSINGQGPVGYKGNELVVELRKKLKDLPIFMITTISDDEEVQGKFSEFEYIINRNEFEENGEKYIPIIIRASQRYLDSNQKELVEYEFLTKEAARGNLYQKTLERLHALHAKLEIPFSGFEDRNGWLETYENHINELEELKKQIQQKLK